MFYFTSRFRADRNIEFFGFELYGLNPEFFTKDGQRFSITGQFKVYNGKKELLDDGISCELHGFFSDVRLCFPTRSRPIEANKWYRIDFKIKVSFVTCETWLRLSYILLYLEPSLKLILFCFVGTAFVLWKKCKEN